MSHIEASSFNLLYHKTSFPGPIFYPFPEVRESVGGRTGEPGNEVASHFNTQGG